MYHISQKKVIVSYIISSLVMFLFSASFNAASLLGSDVAAITTTLPAQLVMIIQLTIVLVANLFLHFMFYYGGLNSSPMAKGIGIGTALGLVYFIVTVFGLNLYDINTAPVQELVGALTGRVIEYCSGGIATAFVSVSNIHKWGVLKAI